MSYEYKKDVICPYCDCTQTDIFEIDGVYESDESWTDCDDCGKEFRIETIVTHDFSTYKKTCKGGNHEWGEGDIYLEIDEHHISRMKRRDPEYKNEPHMWWRRHCKHCDEYESKRTGPDASDPWGEK